ncbi:MAG: hypothetical protein L6R38_001747 [Xanthoria sp. 2 TBL-2021]|nr:MAG: hypothetical protein L6R38_001747 [Xanthoria sp. 2 TBL-2021]
MDIFTNSWSAFEDLIIWALPIPILYKLKPASISFISIACAIIRANAFVIWIKSADISWNFPIYPLLCVIEPSVALVTSSLLGIYPLFRQPAPEHRRPVVPPPADSEQGGTWNSQGSTLHSAQAGDRRSRWIFLSWHGNAAAAKKAPDESIKSVPEEEPQNLNTEERPGTQRTMKGYVSSTDEAAPAGQHSGSHRRIFSSDDAESLCYVGKAMDRVSSLSASPEEDNEGQLALRITKTISLPLSFSLQARDICVKCTFASRDGAVS